MLLLGRADFVRRGLAHGFADGRAAHAVLRRGDPVRDGLSRHNRLLRVRVCVCVCKEKNREREKREVAFQSMNVFTAGVESALDVCRDDQDALTFRCTACRSRANNERALE